MNMSATTEMTTTGKLREDMARAMSAAQSGDRAGAYDMFQSLATRNENSPELWVWLGGTSPNLDEAEAAFQRAVLLDPNNEEANLGLRWVGLRRQMLHATGTQTAPTLAGLDTGVIAQGRAERTSPSFDLNPDMFDASIPAATGPLGTGLLTNSAGATSTGNLTGPLRTADTDIVLIVIALMLYAFAAYMLFVNK
jgi:hypothetical protein